MRGGNIALIAAGTGLGQALLHNVNGRFIPSPSEAGHADFAARTEREIALLRDLTDALRPRRSRARGLGPRAGQHPSRHAPTRPVAAAIDLDRCGRAGSDHHGGARAAMPRLRRDARDVRRRVRRRSRATWRCGTVSTGGLYIGGGIAPKILPALTDRALHAGIPRQGRRSTRCSRERCR